MTTTNMLTKDQVLRMNTTDRCTLNNIKVGDFIAHLVFITPIARVLNPILGILSIPAIIRVRYARLQYFWKDLLTRYERYLKIDERKRRLRLASGGRISGKTVLRKGTRYQLTFTPSYEKENENN